MTKSSFYIGTAGWTVPKVLRDSFFEPGAVKPNHLKSYSAQFSAVEINSSFYREHQASTYLKWAQSTPEHFRFSIKLAKRFTHIQKLEVDSTDLTNVLGGVQNLGEKLGVVLVQLPPKLAFDGQTAEDFFATFRELYNGPIALEPRHLSWVSREATKLLEEYHIARVIADPDRIGDGPSIRSSNFAYFRLHGSPKVYYDSYEAPALKTWAERLKKASLNADQCWCIFDNTALGYATGNALDIQKLLKIKKT